MRMDRGLESSDFMAAPEASDEELRSAQRFALLIRTAKIICKSGEYLCIVRDISATGVRLRMFHALPPFQSLALELGNGDSYALERVWESEDHAGFRFLTPIDVHAFMQEPSKWPRRPIRVGLRLPAMIRTGGAASAATVHNFSRYGAGIETGLFLALEQKLYLEVEGHGPIGASVSWRSGQVYGLILRQTFTFEDLARLAYQLQPFGAQNRSAVDHPGRNSMASPFMQ